jgi:hypothetical protein
MRHVDHNAHAVAAADHLGTEGRETAMDAGFGLDVAQLVRPVVRELQMAKRPAPIGLVETLDLALEEVGTFGRANEGTPAGPRGAQLRRRPDDRQALRASERVQLIEGAPAELVELARARIAAWPQAATAKRDDR